MSKLVYDNWGLIHINNMAPVEGNNIAGQFKKFMSITKKRPSFLKVLIFSFSLLFFLAAISSCEKQYINFGSGFIDNSVTNLIMLDSSTVEVSTVYVDSFATSNTHTIFAGKFKDQQFGAINAQSFLQLGLPASTTYDIPNGSTFDSLEVILKLNKVFYGDTLSPYKIEVHQLIAPITYSANQYAFYNINSRQFNTQELGSNQMIVSPTSTDTIAIKLDPALGKDIFNKLQSTDPIGQALPEFINYFKGIAIVGGSGNNLILGFNDSLKMRLHYHKPDVITQNAMIDFGINETNYQFNNITADRTGTPIAALGPANKQLFSSTTQNAGFEQYITGAVVKIRFPYLSDLYQLPDFIKIIKAQLIIKPVQNSFLGPYQLPPYLRLSTTDQNNLLGSDISAPNTTGASAVQYGNLFIDNLYGTNTEYTYDITSYLQAQIAITEINQNGLIVSPPNAAATFNRILIANGAVTNNKTQVNIYYAAVK